MVANIEPTPEVQAEVQQKIRELLALLGFEAKHCVEVKIATKEITITRFVMDEDGMIATFDADGHRYTPYIEDVIALY